MLPSTCTLSPTPRVAPLAAVAAMHLVAVAGLLAIPAVREGLIYQAPLFVEYREVARAKAPESSPLPAPAMHGAPAVTIALPQIALATEIAPSPSPRETPNSASEPSTAPSPAPVPIEAPRFDMAYLENPPPAYPSLARRMKEQGRVILRVLVSAAGEAQDIEVRASSGSERLDRAAIDAVRRWRFAPARRGAETIAAYAFVPIVFRLET